MTPDTPPTVAVFHGDGNITLYPLDEDGVTVHESPMLYRDGADVRLEFLPLEAIHLRHTVPLRDTLEYLGLPDPYTPAALEAAWENAERADKCHEGDVLIEFLAHGSYYVYSAARDYSSPPPSARILSRSSREPWQDLADVLRAHTGEPAPDDTAKMLYGLGVRMAGGDES